MFKGAYLSSRPDENAGTIEGLLRSLSPLGLDLAACRRAGLIYRGLKKRGKMMSEFDVLNASILQQSNEVLITGDAHFQEIPGINLRSW
jgi:predicted nucleic acid-binding protein